MNIVASLFTIHTIDPYTEYNIQQSCRNQRETVKKSAEDKIDKNKNLTKSVASKQKK